MNPRVTHLNLRLVQPGNFGIRLAPDRDQNFVENLFAFLDFGTVEGHADAVGFLFHGGDRRVQQNGRETFLHPLVQRKNQIAVGAGEQPGQHLDHGNFRSQRRVHRAQLQADVAAADHQQRSRHFAQIQAEVESITRGVSSLRLGIIAGREPVARMMRSKLRLSSPPPAFEIRNVFEFSKAARP